MTRGHHVVLFMAAFVPGACGGDARPATPDTAPGVPLDIADTVTIDAPATAPAQLYVEHDAVVYARSEGIVESVDADLGERVEAGQVLAQLEHVDQEIAREQARVAYAAAEQAWTRARGLAGSGVITPADSELAEYGYQRARLALRQAERAYDLTRVVAPFDGAVTSRQVRARRLVAPGDTLFRITALAPLRAAVHLPESAALGVAVGAKVEIVAGSGSVVPARVIRASPTIDAASGTREVVIELEPRSRLVPGAAVVVRLGTERRRVVAIPASALTENGYVMVWEHGRSVLRAVTLGAVLPDGRREVVSGLEAGERLVRAGR